jgi:NlpC/P60 family
MAKIRTLTELQQCLGWLKRDYEKRYGHAVWDLRCRPDLLKSEVFIYGHVLLPSQMYAARRAVASHLRGKMRCHFEIEVLAAADSGRQSTWGSPATDVLNVYSRPLERKSSKSTWGEFLSTQALVKDKPFRIVSEYNGWLLIQLHDFTFGWAQTELVDVAGHADAGGWTPLRRAGTHKLITPRHGPAALIEQAREYARAPYVAGGVTASGFDCSGLIQRIYKDALEIILPKHSRDQILAGRGFAFECRQRGDLIFFSKRGGRDLHVGLLYDEDRVVHASSRRGFVTIEEIANLPASVDVAQVRRVINSAPAVHPRRTNRRTWRAH